MPVMLPDTSRLVPLTEETFQELLTYGKGREVLTGLVERFDWQCAFKESLCHVHPEDDATAMGILHQREAELSHFFQMTNPLIADTYGKWYLAHFLHPELDQLYREKVGAYEIPLDVELIPVPGGFVPEVFVLDFTSGGGKRISRGKHKMISFLPPGTPEQTKALPVWDDALTRRAIKSIHDHLQGWERYIRFTNVYHCLSFPDFIFLPGNYHLTALADGSVRSADQDPRAVLLECNRILWTDFGENHSVYELFDERNTEPLKRYLALAGDIFKTRVPDPSEGRIFCWQRYI